MLNKKIAATSAAVLVAAAGVANAGAFDETRFNLGGEISVLNYTKYNTNSTSDINKFKSSSTSNKLAIRKNEPGINIFLGARFNQNFGAEVGFGFIAKAKGTNQFNQTATNKISNLYADVLGFLPVANKVDLVGSVGIGYLKSKANVTNTTFQNLSSLNKGKVGYRLGLGAQYSFTDNWAARAMVRYQSGNKNFLKSNTSVSLGALYSF